MQASVSAFPDQKTLSLRLNAIFRNEINPGCQVAVIDREPYIYASTFRSEIVTCELEDGTKLRLLCKYSGGQNNNSYGHRRGVKYEADVYRDVLRPLGVSVPRFYGAFTDFTTGETCLVLEHLDGSVRVEEAAEGLIQAARWIGGFHAVNDLRLCQTPTCKLNTYDYGYYLGWARRTFLFAGPLHDQFPWLSVLCERFEEFIVEFLEVPGTIIHGEFCVENILIHDGIICPVDWESAAVAFGEIDLIALTEGWPADIVRECQVEYYRSRSSQGLPVGSGRRLNAAKVYWNLRWLGDRPSWTRHKSTHRFKELHHAGEELGLL
jgi:hypothetical protein